VKQNIKQHIIVRRRAPATIEAAIITARAADAGAMSSFGCEEFVWSVEKFETLFVSKK